MIQRVRSRWILICWVICKQLTPIYTCTVGRKEYTAKTRAAGPKSSRAMPYREQEANLIAHNMGLWLGSVSFTVWCDDFDGTSIQQYKLAGSLCWHGRTTLDSSLFNQLDSSSHRYAYTWWQHDPARMTRQLFVLFQPEFCGHTPCILHHPPLPCSLLQNIDTRRPFRLLFEANCKCIDSTCTLAAVATTKAQNAVL